MRALWLLAVLCSGSIAHADPDPDDGPPLEDPSGAKGNDKDVIRKGIKAQIPKIEYCYEKALLAEPTLTGTVKASFTIEADGTVSASTATGMSTVVATCVAGVIKATKFDKLANKITVNYPFVFHPSDTPPPPPSKTESDDDRIVIRRNVKRSIDKIQYCYEKALLADPKLAGTVTVTFTIEATGKVSSSLGTGLVGVDTCVAGVIKAITFTGITKKVVTRYPFVFKAASDATPTPTTGKPASPDPDRVMIARHIRANVRKIQYCYEKALLADAKLQGKVTAKFTIGADGKVSSSTADGVSKDVSACVAAVIEKIAFDRPSNGTPTPVSYPFIFRPAGS